MAKITFFPLGNADCALVDLFDGSKWLFDYADMRNPMDAHDKRADLPSLLRRDLEVSRRDYYDVVCFTHLDNDHCCGASEFFRFSHATKYGDEGRPRIAELWVPAAAVLEVGVSESARVIRQEARHRLREGHGIRVFSRPAQLKEWLEGEGLTLESRRHLIVDAGQEVPGLSLGGPQQVAVFLHSPFAWRLNEYEVVDRNQDSCGLQITFREGERITRALLLADLDYESLGQIVKTTKSHGNEARLGWDILKIPHHCSYLSVGPEKCENITNPTEETQWLYTLQASPRCVMVSSSWPIPEKGTPDDDDVQPPHRQTAAFYKQVEALRDGEFLVTMEEPAQVNPKPLVVEITESGARCRRWSAYGVAAVAATPVRAG